MTADKQWTKVRETPHTVTYRSEEYIPSLEIEQPKSLLDQLRREAEDKLWEEIVTGKRKTLFAYHKKLEIENARLEAKKELLDECILVFEKEIAECIIRQNQTQGYEFNRQCGIHCGYKNAKEYLEKLRAKTLGENGEKKE